jgi:hypothetical protein
MKKYYLKWRPYLKEIGQILFGLLFLAFTMVQCTKIDYNFERGQMSIIGTLAQEPIERTSAENSKSIELMLDQYPGKDFSYSPQHFAHKTLPRLHKRLSKGDTVVLEVFVDDYKRTILGSPTLTEYLIFGALKIISVQVKGDKYENITGPENDEPSYIVAFLIYTVVCFLIINAYVNLVEKLDINNC